MKRKREGTAKREGRLREMFVGLAKRAGVEGATLHHLRHGFMTALLDRGVGGCGEGAGRPCGPGDDGAAGARNGEERAAAIAALDRMREAAWASTVGGRPELAPVDRRPTSAVP